VRFAAQLAALDREETAAAVYAESISQLARLVPDSVSGRALSLAQSSDDYASALEGGG